MRHYPSIKREHITSVIDQVNANILVGVKCGGITSEQDVEDYKEELISAIKSINVHIGTKTIKYKE